MDATVFINQVTTGTFITAGIFLVIVIELAVLIWMQAKTK